MTTVRDFQVDDLQTVRPHEDVDAVVRLIECNGEKLFQIDTNGRSSREHPNKLSQTVSLNKNEFEKLIEVGASHF